MRRTVFGGYEKLLNGTGGLEEARCGIPTKWKGGEDGNGNSSHEE